MKKFAALICAVVILGAVPSFAALKDELAKLVVAKGSKKRRAPVSKVVKAIRANMVNLCTYAQGG